MSIGPIRAFCACVATLVLVLGHSRPAVAATPAEVDASIKKAKDYLYSQLKADNWELVAKMPAADRQRHNVNGWQWGGVTGTAVYGLLAAGENPQDPRIKAAVEWLKKAEIRGHYASAMRAQVWHMLKDDRDKASAKLDRNILLNAIITANPKGPEYGFYSYYTDDKGKIEDKWYDRSVAQISVLGVWAVEQAGQEIPNEYWRIVDAVWKRSQKPDGGWNYRDEGDHGKVSGTMTAAGIATLFITQDYLMQAEPGRFSSCRGGQRNEWIEKGLAWMDKNAPALLKNAPHYYYQMYGIERIGVASGRKYFGTTDWYAVGADELVKKQNKDGSWGGDDAGHNPKKVPDTVFSILFLTRGRAPVVMNKLEYDIAPEPGKKAVTLPDPWNQRPRDVANFAHWASKTSEQYLNWQVVNLKVSAADLHDAPILYVAGSSTLRFTPEELNKLREFVEGGGMILGNADCGNPLFTKSYVELAQQLFPKYEMRELPKNHPIYTDQQYKPNRWRVQPKIMGISNGVRELMLMVPEADLGKWWQLRSEKTKVESFEVMQDIFLYAVDKKGLNTRGVNHTVAKNAKVAADRSLSVARLMVGENPDPEPGAWRRLANLVHNEQKIALKVENVKLGEGKLGGYKLAAMTGTAKFKLGEEQKAELKDWVAKGGTLLIDAAGGSSDFAEAAEQELRGLFGSAGTEFGQVLPPDHPIFLAAGKKIDRFSYRTYVKGRLAGELNAPRLKAHLIDGRPAVLYSREDLTAGMVGQPVDGVLGYSPETATAVVQAVVSYVAGKPPGKPPEAKPAAAAPAPKPAAAPAKPTAASPVKPAGKK